MSEIPYGFCHCKCGGKTQIATMTQTACGWIKGEPKRYIFNHHRRKPADEYWKTEDLGYTSPCWVWTGPPTEDGYGRMQREGRSWYSHVWYYTQARGPVPEGLTVDHLCHNAVTSCTGGPTCRHRACVNPDHLEPKTHAENVQAGRSMGRRKTHCKHGHEFTEENTNIGSDGNRRCRTCQNKAMLAYYYRTRGAKPKSDSP